MSPLLRLLLLGEKDGLHAAYDDAMAEAGIGDGVGVGGGIRD